MAVIHYQFPIKSAHGRFEKDGMVFKQLNETKFTCNYRKSSLPPTPRQLAQREQFKAIAERVASFYDDASAMSSLRALYSEQDRYKTFKKYLWHAAGVELGIYSD